MKQIRQQIKKLFAGKSVYRISLYVIVPFIFSGISTISFLIAFDIANYYAHRDMATQGKLVPWVFVIGLLSFLCGLLVIWLVLKPVKKFMKEAKELPVFPRTAMEDRTKGAHDDIGHFSLVFTEVKNILSKVKAKELFPEIIGESSLMRGLFNQILKVASADATVLIMGESGTGKELVADSIFKNSLRRNNPFVKLNCVAIPEGLLESELFGHEKGAFTGAVARKRGKFELADGGTIFLDEIGDMTLATQAKLLRVLQEKTFERVGGNRPIKVDVRFIAATNKNLVELIKARKFREDLYYRLNVFSMVLPPLRERRKDIPLLVEHFLESAPRKVTMSQMALERLLIYAWPGNVRELENTIERASLMAEGGVIEAFNIPSNVSFSITTTDFEKEDAIDDRLGKIEKRMILDALIKTGGSQTKAAQLLGIKERSLWHRIKKYSIAVKDLDQL